MDTEKVIHCIGDSHASFFSGYDEIQPVFPEESVNKYPFFKSYRLGAVLAYSLVSLGTKERGREKLMSLVEQLPKGSTLLLCFGEIDCRFHLLKQAYDRKTDVSAIITECVQRYFSVIDELKDLGFKILIWNVVPTSLSYNPEYPTFGSEVERNKVTISFNSHLQHGAFHRNITYVSIFDKLINKDLKTKKIFLFDGVHLGQLAMPYALKAIKNSNQNFVSITYSNFFIGLLIYRSSNLYYFSFLTHILKNKLRQIRYMVPRSFKFSI